MSDERSKKFKSIFPYLKQLKPSVSTSSAETLPSDTSHFDKNKTYSIPGLSLVIKNISEDLNCLYAYDTEHSLEIIQEKELAALNITREQLHEIAMNNYRDLVNQKLKSQSNGQAFWFILDGNLEAALVLVDEIWDQVEGHLKETVVVCAPSRDVLIATGKSNAAVIFGFTEKAKDILSNGDHPLSNYWHVRENKAWKAFRKIID